MGFESAARPRPTLLVIDDDRALAQILAETLAASASRVWVAHSAAEARRILQRRMPDLILLDLMLPDTDGLMLCSEIRAIADVPVIICSGTTERRDAVLALKLGADDFIPKPFDMYELEARIEAVLRRAFRPPTPASSATPFGTLQVGPLIIDVLRKRALVGGAHIPFTMTEYRLVSALAEKADRIVTRKELARAVWERDDVSDGRTIDVHIRRIRMKLQSAPVAPPTITTLRGFGYRMLPPDASDNGRQ